MKSFRDFNIQPEFPLKGVKESIVNLKGKPIIINNFRFFKKVEDNNEQVDVSQIQFTFEGETVNRVTFTRSIILKKQLEQIDKKDLPISAVIREKDRCLYLE